MVGPSDNELKAPDVAIASAAYWADFYSIQLQSGTFDFTNHEYQQEPMDYRGRRKCVRKATQGGWTETEVLSTLHGQIHGRYPLGVLYLFPTSDDVGEFSKSRFGPLIEANRRTIGKYVRNTDTTTLKKVGTSFLYLRGARLSQHINEESHESSKLRSISVDRIDCDEFDLMDPEVREKCLARMAHSTVKEENYLSNPTLPDYGIDLLFKQSDQRYWFRQCPCGAWTCPELTFPQCVKMWTKGESPTSHRGYVACSKCGKPLRLYPGKWIPQVAENTEYMAGYHWSQLTSAFVDPAEILEAYNEPPNGNLGDIYRLRLGLPYAAAEDRLLESQVYNCCGNDLPLTYHEGPAAMGVDVGKVKHVVIGVRTGNDQYEILRAVAVSEWSDIHDLAKKYGVRSAVVDIRPYEDSAREFQKAESYPIYLCEYSDTMTTGPQYNLVTGVVKVNRTEIFDKTHRMIVTDGMVRLPRQCQEVKEFARQMCNTAKTLEKNKRTGAMIYRYKAVGSGEDHFRNAFNYFALAASGSKIAKVGTSFRDRPKRAINTFRVGAR